MFIFGDKTSDEMGLQIVQSTLFTSSGEAYNTISIPNLAEPVIESENCFKPVKINLECDTDGTVDIKQILSWLHGKGIIIDDRYPDVYRIAHILDEVKVTAVNDDLFTIHVPLICSAFMYNVENEPVEITDNNSVINVGGTYYCEPVIELHFKSGTSPQEFTFYINGQGITINLTAEHLNHVIILDARSQKIYYKDNNYLIMPDTSGAVPFLNCGGYNSISWSSDIIQKVIITKNERWR